MTWFRLNALAVGCMTTTVLLGAITCYLLALRRKGKDTWWLAGYLGSLFLLLLAYMVRYSIFTEVALSTGQVSNLIVFGVACLVQFAYWFGGNRYRLESRVAAVITFGISTAVWGMLFFPGRYPAVYDFHAEYFTYEFGPSVSIFSLIEYIWALVVFVRRAVAPVDSAARGLRASLHRLLRPEDTLARSHRSFALLTLATIPIALQYVLYQTGVIPRATYALVFNTGSLLICLLIFIVYINNAPHPTSFVTKLVGLPLAVLMVAFGIASNALMPVVERTVIDRYRAEARLAEVALETQQLSRLPHDVAYLLPTSIELDTLRYGSPQLFRPTEMLLRAMPRRRGTGGSPLAPRFHYYSFSDPSSFYLSFPLQHLGERYSVGFSYADYRLLVHEFAWRLALVVIAACAVVIVGFPLFFRRGLWNPLKTLVAAVARVSEGNFGQMVQPVSDDEIGRLSQGYNLMIDSLKSMEGNFKALAENAYDAIFILSEQGVIRFANERAAQLAGRPVVRLFSVPVTEVIADAELAVQPGREAYETSGLRADGERVPIEVAVARTTWQTQPALVVVARDISERRHAEELLRAQQVKLMRTDKLSSLGELVAAVAHEINNPNHVVSAGARFLEEGMTALLAMAETSPELDGSVRIAGRPYHDFKAACRTVVTDIAKSALRIDHIVRELKRYVRGANAEWSLVDMNEVVGTVVDLARYTIEQASTGFVLDLATEAVRVRGDFVELEQVTLNLLENACQSISPASGTVSVHTRFDGSAREVCLEVADNGSGMTEAQLAHATEPFFTSRAERGGSGLGLSVVNRIVKSHGGRLSFESSTGSGTIVTVRLPAAEASGGGVSAP